MSTIRSFFTPQVTRSSRHPISMRLPRAVRGSPRRTRPVRSACPRARRSQPGATCTRSATGTTVMLTKVPFRAGTMRCAMRATASCRSASCTSADGPATITGSRKRSCPCMSSMASATSRAWFATTFPSAREATRWRTARAPANRHTWPTTGTSLRARRSGCTKKRRSGPSGRGCCSCRSRPRHPYHEQYEYVVDYDTHFTTDADVKRAVAGYSGLVSMMDENIGNVLRALRDTGHTHNTRVIYTSDHGDNVGARGLWGKSTLYEESAGVPLIMAGPAIPRGRVIDTPVSHIDCAPTILEATGEPPRIGGRELPGASLFDVANGAKPTRPVISEYHATASIAAAYMLRFGRFKYCHYVAYRPQLFDLAEDPEELLDLAADPRYASTLAEGERLLRAALDPEGTDQRAKRRQAELLASFGGREKALARGDLGFTPAPGTAAEMN